MSVGLRMEKSNILSSDRGRTQNCVFSVLNRKYSFWASLVQKTKLSISAELCRICRICRIKCWCSLFPEIPFLGKFGPKIQNCLFKLKPGTETNSNMQNSMELLPFPGLDQKYPLWANLIQKIKIGCLTEIWYLD